MELREYIFSKKRKGLDVLLVHLQSVTEHSAKLAWVGWYARVRPIDRPGRGRCAPAGLPGRGKTVEQHVG